MSTINGTFLSFVSDITQAFNKLGSSVSKLASGMRINSASDDAAGMTVREMLRADLATSKQASRNIGDGVSMVQTAEGAASAISENLTHMKQLAAQASNGTLSDQQKNIIQQEFDQLAEQNSQIAATTEFNGINLFTDSQTIDIALGDGDAISFDTQDIAAIDADLVNDPNAALAAVDTAINEVSQMRGDLGATAKRMESAGDVMSVKTENIMAAESRISDVDVATETTRLTANKIIAQSAIAVQVHANAMAGMMNDLLD